MSDIGVQERHHRTGHLVLNVVTRIVAGILIIVMTASLVLYALGMRSMYVVSNSMSPTFS